MMVGTIVYDYYEMYTLYILSQLYRSLNFFTFYLHGHFPEKYVCLELSAQNILKNCNAYIFCDAEIFQNLVIIAFAIQMYFFFH